MAAEFAEIESAAERETTDRLAPHFGASGLITAVVTDSLAGDVLMLAHMDREALAKTLETGQAWFYSRSRQKLWRKGESSGETMAVVEIRTDCDQDAVWLKVRMEGKGSACHTGQHSCFYRVVDPKSGKLRND
jgi:phosphoribosyl-AMP cyclohydrolase